MTKIISTNPARSFEPIGSVIVTSNADIKRKVKEANEAKEAWGKLDIIERIRLVRGIYKACRKNADRIAELITKEIGTPITECKEEIDWSWGYFEWFLDNVQEALAPEITHEDKMYQYKVLYEPYGAAAVITPWNLPFDMFLWGAIPNLLAGNTVIYKASAECALTGKLLEEITSQVDIPKGVLSFIHGNGSQGEFLVNQEIDLLWFTGSSEVGRKLYKIAAGKFIKAVMELGGSNPAIVFEDADIDIVVNRTFGKRFSFCGQTCDALKRLIVHESIAEKVALKLKEKAEALLIGDPLDEKTEIGPLVSRKQLTTLIAQVEDGLVKGASIIAGGKQPEHLNGAYYYPTIITNIKTSMKVWREEVFGPVLPIITFKTEEEALKLANDTAYGLGSQVYTKNINKALRVAKNIKAGGVDINGAGHFKPYNPFGGMKNSGMGREHGRIGFQELCQMKLVAMEK